VTETERHGAYLRYTDDFLLFSDDKARLWELRAGVVAHLASVRLVLAEPKSRLLATGEGVSFCGFRFLQGLHPRILGATKRRFERRRRSLAARRDFRRLTACVFAWYQFSREGNTEGLRRAYGRDARLAGRSLGKTVRRIPAVPALAENVASEPAAPSSVSPRASHAGSDDRPANSSPCGRNFLPEQGGLPGCVEEGVFGFP
jgi:hypothetical protein